MIQICSLCDQPKKLSESHLIPKFVFRWLKNTGGPHIRRANNPNKRVNDGPKQKLLCQSCEQKFAKLEDRFAREIFYPYTNNGKQIFEYDDYLYKFAISVLWRVALYSFPSVLPRNIAITESVLADWKKFLNGKSHLPKDDKIHIFFTADRLKQDTQPVEKFLNYWARGIDGTIASGKNSIIVYGKLARVMLIGEVSSFDSTGMVNTKIDQIGRIDTTSMEINSMIKDFLIDRVTHLNKKYDKVSEKQLKIAHDYTNTQLIKMKGSDIWNIIQQENTMKIDPNNLDLHNT